MIKYPQKKVNFFIGFPFDPTVDVGNGEDGCSFDKDRFMRNIIGIKKCFADVEILLGPELWDFLSGKKNTMQDILQIINGIAKPDFWDKFELLIKNDPNEMLNQKKILSSWYQYSELKLIFNRKVLVDKTKNNRRLANKLTQACFNDKGEYKRDRYSELMSLLRS